MVTINMSTEPISRGWTRLSSNENVNKSKSDEQLAPPTYRYAAPNYFATPNYDMETSPVAASTRSRRVRSSSHALPSALPSSMEMQNVDLSSINSHSPPAPGTLPTPVTQPNDPSNLPRNIAWLPILLALTLFIISIALHPNFLSPQPWNRTSWSREGMNGYLDVRQVMFATIPTKVIWGMFLATLGLDVLVLQAVYSYATVAATVTDDRAGKLVSLRYFFFLLVVVIQAILMWGWLLWSI